MKRLLILILVIFAPLLIRAIPLHDLPFGADDLGDVSESSIAQLKDSLGFNIIKLGLPLDNEVLQRFLADSIQPIVTTYWMDSAGAPEKWSYAHYAFMEVGDTNTDKDYRFYNIGDGGRILYSTWEATDSATLVGMDTRFYPENLPDSSRAMCIIDRSYEGGYIQSGNITWNLEIALKLDTLVDGNTLLGWIEGWPVPTWDVDMMPAAPESGWTTIHIGDIRGSQFSQPDSFHNLIYQFAIPEMVYYKKDNSNDTLLLPNDEPNGGGIGFNLRIHTTSAVDTLTVDWVKLYEQNGLNLATNDFSTMNYIKSFLEQYNTTLEGQNIFAWYMRDEPIFTNLDPIGKIDSLIRDKYSSWRHFTINNQTSMMRSYLSRTHSDLIDMDYYPLGPADLYTGFAPEVPDQEQHSFQNRMNYMNGWMWYYRDKADDMEKQLWLTPQAFWDLGDSANAPCWRKPTPSELWCMTSIALCYRVEGLLYWKYDPDGRFQGIRMFDEGYNRIKTDLFYKIKNDINPYIKAIDSIYLQLNWLNAYTYHNPDSIPAGSIIDSIDAQYQFPCHCVRNNAEYPTDIGWFHVGEFKDDFEPAVKYFMLVNRSCSLCEWDSTETSPVIATVNLNPAIVGSNYALIIDLAKGTSASDWTGYPETTYSGILDGSIPYTVNLKAGEGRLFKVIPTNEIPFEVTLDEQGFIYQGGLNAAGEFVIDTLRLRGPAVINASPDDTTSISVNGAIIAEGFENEQIVFRSDSSGGWEGIVIGSNAYGDFKYCSMINAVTGIEINQGSELNVSYCLFDSITTNGIENTRGNLSVSNCYFKYNLLKGVNSFAGVAIIDSTTFENCCRYGIYINNHPTGTYDSTIISNCSIYQTASPESAQYGIYVYNNAKIRLANNLIRNTGQGGIRLSAGNAKVCSVTVRSEAYNGILGENGAIANAQYCTLDTLNTGIYLTSGTGFIVRRTKFKNQVYGVRTWARPDLGTTRSPGNNDFAGCSSMYIYYTTLQTPPPTLYAQYNYFGPGIPDPNKFSAGVNYGYYLPDPPLKRRPFEEIPLNYSLNSNYPNPFNPQTSILFNLIEPAQTKVLIYNVLGQKIKTLVNEYLSPGQYSYIWDGRNELGIEAASGVYLYRIESGSFVQTKKTLIR